MAVEEKSKENSVTFILIDVKTETTSGVERSFSDNQKLFNDPKIMVADTGATCDST